MTAWFEGVPGGGGAAEMMWWDENEPCLVEAARPDPLDPFRVEQLAGAWCNPVLLDGVLQQVSMVPCVERDGRTHCIAESAKPAARSTTMALLVSVPEEAARELRAAAGGDGRYVAKSADGAVTLWAARGDLEVLAQRWPEQTRVEGDMSATMRAVVQAGPDRLHEMAIGWASGESRCLWGIEAFEALELNASTEGLSL